LSCKKLTFVFVIHYNTASSKGVKRGKKYTLKMPLERMKKFIRFSIHATDRMTGNWMETTGKTKEKRKKEKRRKKTKKFRRHSIS